MCRNHRVITSHQAVAAARLSSPLLAFFLLLFSFLNRENWRNGSCRGCLLLLLLLLCLFVYCCQLTTSSCRVPYGEIDGSE